jgi:2-polyprenyl-3-methyl-5-hydroxy-6-metoxy-1,4-benzoquinol methylase
MMTQAAGRIRIETTKPIAYDSPDHIQPYGTASNNTTSPRFNRKLLRMIPASEIRLLDIGCSGGGLVKSIIDDGGFAVGIEGSDYSLRHKRAEWATIPGNLFTADATVPFQLTEEGPDGSVVPLKFNVITAWEFFEHIAEDHLAPILENIKNHLAPNGIVLASIANWEDVVEGVRLHQTVERKAWWIKKFEQLGMTFQPSVEKYFAFDMLRGEPIGASFTIALTRAGETPIHRENMKVSPSEYPYEAKRFLGWACKPATWKYLAWIGKRRIEAKLGGRPFN